MPSAYTKPGPPLRCCSLCTGLSPQHSDTLLTGVNKSLLLCPESFCKICLLCFRSAEGLASDSASEALPMQALAAYQRLHAAHPRNQECLAQLTRICSSLGAILSALS